MRRPPATEGRSDISCLHSLLLQRFDQLHLRLIFTCSTLLLFEKATASAGKGPDKPAGGGATGDESKGSKGESTAARASGLVARCQRLEQENEELAASADVAKGVMCCV